MSRLRRNLKSYVASLRMTNVDVILFFEGKENDPIFYFAVAQQFSQRFNSTVDLRRADELPNAANIGKGGSGGKLTLLRAATFWHRWKATSAVLWSQERRIHFCIDKDADVSDDSNDQRLSVIRTRLHSVENHLVHGTDLPKALSAAFGVPEPEIERHLNPVSTCRARLAHLWRDWTVFSLLSLRLDSGVGGYARVSPINSPAHTAPSGTLYLQHLAMLQQASGLDATEFATQRQAVEAEVDALIALDRFDEVFKGKWYSDILFALFKSITSTSFQCRTAGKNGIWIGVRSQFSLLDADYTHYEARLRV